MLTSCSCDRQQQGCKDFMDVSCAWKIVISCLPARAPLSSITVRNSIRKTFFLSQTKSENHLMKMSFECESCYRCLIARHIKSVLNIPAGSRRQKTNANVSFSSRCSREHELHVNHRVTSLL